MRTHELKLNKEFFEDVRSGRKTFEIRENDRGYQAGDILELRCWSTSHHCYTEPYSPIKKKVSYVLSGWGLKEGYVALALADVY